MNWSVSTADMMEMCMQDCRMCMIFCAKISGKFSISEVNSYAA